MMNVLRGNGAPGFHVETQRGPKDAEANQKQDPIFQCLSHSPILSKPKNPPAAINPAISQRNALA